MRLLLKALVALLLLAVVGLPLALLAALWFAVDDRPTLTRAAEIKPEAVSRAKRIIERNDPRRVRPGTLRSIVVAGEDLDLAVNYLAQEYGRGSGEARLQEGVVTIRASLPLPSNPFGKFANVEAVFAEAPTLPRIEALAVGRLPIPSIVARWIVDWGMSKWSTEANAGRALGAIRQVSMRDGALMVSYEWDDTLPASLSRILIAPDDEARLKAYQELVVSVSQSGGRGALPLERVLEALLVMAGQRSGDAAAENRAALLILAFFVNGKGLGAILPSAKTWPKPAQRNVTLAGRHDFAQHFSVSAALAATAGSPLSNAVGLFKEIDDSRGGSGFSFNDIAADRAGTRFAELAVSGREGAVKVQRLAAGLTAGSIFPKADDLPEFMPEAEFRRRFGGTEGLEYKRLMAEINRRIAALPPYRD